jgi:hypothetical protein
MKIGVIDKINKKIDQCLEWFICVWFLSIRIRKISLYIDEGFCVFGGGGMVGIGEFFGGMRRRQNLGLNLDDLGSSWAELDG